MKCSHAPTPIANFLSGGIDEVFTRSESTGTLAPLVDGLGSTIGLSNSSGAVQTQYTYEPFGKTSASGTASTNASQFTGRENDGTALYYYRGRYYSPQLQRFISEDPIGLLGGVNLYAYVGNNPINLTDPFGLKPIDKPSLSGYMDVNVSFGMPFIGPTGGLMFGNDGGIYPYLGAAVTKPGLGGSVTFSPDNVSGGFNAELQGGLGIINSIGWDEEGNSFVSHGAGPLGGSASLYIVLGATPPTQPSRGPGYNNPNSATNSNSSGTNQPSRRNCACNAP